MSFNRKLFARVGDKGALAFVRFTDVKVAHDDRNVCFEIVWSCGGDRLPTGKTGVVYEADIAEMIEEGSLYEVSELTDPYLEASA